MFNEDVELKDAYFWNCPGCAAENFERVVIVDDPDKLRVMWESDDPGFDLEPGMVAVLPPTEVTCCSCKRQFNSVVD